MNSQFSPISDTRLALGCRRPRQMRSAVRLTAARYDSSSRHAVDLEQPLQHVGDAMCVGIPARLEYVVEEEAFGGLLRHRPIGIGERNVVSTSSRRAAGPRSAAPRRF